MSTSTRFDDRQVPRSMTSESGRRFVRAERPKGPFRIEEEYPWRGYVGEVWRGRFLNDDTEWLCLNIDGPQDVWGEFWYREVAS